MTTISGLLPGLEFAKQHELSVGEMEIIILLAEAPASTLQIANQLHKSKHAAHDIMRRLCLKGLVVVVEEKEDRTLIFGFKP